MRAEAQNTVAEIEKSLELLGQRLGVETAQYRLEEFNARVEANRWSMPSTPMRASNRIWPTTSN